MEHSVEFSYRKRYFTLGDKSTATKVWFVLHGYGQLADTFIQKFKILTSHQVFLVAPEGLSRFYSEDTTRRMQTGNDKVGAAWMTKEDRLTDVSNYINYLQTAYDAVDPNPELAVTILGFSQGAATAARWAVDGNINFQRLVLWAGILPHDIDLKTGSKILSDKEVVLAYGTKDPFLSDDRFAEMNLLSGKLGITPSVLTFDGGHVIDEDTILKIGA